MRKLEDIRAQLPASEFFHGQARHALLALMLGAGALCMTTGSSGQLWGISAQGWAQLAVGVAVFHQAMVALVWRLQLHFATMSRVFGKRALTVWGGMFMPFLLARPVLLLLAGLADGATLPGGRFWQIGLGGALILPALWAMHSVIRYFTIPRALGGDHFTDTYLNMPPVRDGAFRYNSNAMYALAFLGLWGLALLTGSRNALILALFQHAYIWVHMYCTEEPDMRILYGPGPRDTPAPTQTRSRPTP